MTWWPAWKEHGWQQRCQIKLSKSEYMYRIFKNTHIFPDWLGFFFWFGVLWFSELLMEADNCPFSETLSTSCQNHSTGLPELMVSPSLKILHISVCLLQKPVTTTVVPKLLYSTSQDINCNSDQLNLFIEFMLANVGIPFVLPLSVPQVELFLQNHPLAGNKKGENMLEDVGNQSKSMVM